MSTRVDVRWFKDTEDKWLITGILCRGHAKYGPLGEDIVCASISTAMAILEQGVRQVMEIPCRVNVDKDRAIWEIEWPHAKARDAMAYAIVVASVLKALSEQYPDHVILKEEENPDVI